MPIRSIAERMERSIEVAKPPREFVPHPDACLHKVKPAYRKSAAMITYGGMDPKDVPVDDLACMVRVVDNEDNVDHVYRNRIKGRLTAIRAYCVMCVGGSARAVRMCTMTTCPLWSMRQGNNPFRRRSK